MSCGLDLALGTKREATVERAGVAYHPHTYAHLTC